MTPDQLIIVFLILTAAIVMICLAVMWHADRDAELGRELREAAGSESGARMAIESANLDRLLEQKFTGELRKARRSHRLPANVVRLIPRYRGGRRVHFTPDGDAA